MMTKHRIGTSCCLLLAVVLSLSSPSQSANPRQALAKPSAGMVRIEWLGHAMFLITTAEGIRLVTDPYNSQVGYPLPHPTADIVTVTHEHFDHNAVEEVRGTFKVLRSASGAGKHTVKGIVFTGVPAYHDTEQGKKRGQDVIFCFPLDGLRLCHLGDLGQSKLTVDQLKAIGPVDVLMIPVGGYYTIDAKTAWNIIGQLKPKAIIPMHFKTKQLSPKVPIHPVGEFTKGHQQVKLIKNGVLELSTKTLPKAQTVYVLDKFD